VPWQSLYELIEPCYPKKLALKVDALHIH